MRSGFQDWTQVAVKCGEEYARTCLEANHKALRFLGGTLVEFMANIESIHDITSKEPTDSPNDFWSANKSGVGRTAVPVRVCVDPSESRLTVTYFAQHKWSAFVSHAMCGLFRRFAQLMFKANASVSQRTATNGQYVFVLSLEDSLSGRDRDRTNSVAESESDFNYFRHRDRLSNDPRDLFMSVRTFSRAFPFHFICDTDLRLVQIGSGMVTDRQYLHKCFL